MSLKLRRRRIRFSSLKPAHRRPGIFRSDVFGTYHHQYLAVELPRYNNHDQFVAEMTDLEREMSRAIAEASNGEPPRAGTGGSFEERVVRAMTTAAYFHEMRHFHDCFGTFAGVTLFLNYLHVMELFLRACRALRRSNSYWRVPVSKWISETACPKEVGLAFREYQRARQLRLLFLGNVALPSEAGETDEIARLFVPTGGIADTNDFAFPAFPMHFERYVKGRPARRVGFAPLGFEALIEGNAQALQRSIIASWWGGEVAGEVMQRMRLVELSSEHDDPEPSVYLATDFMLTRLLRQRGIAEFQQSLILDLTDAALMNSCLFSFIEESSDADLRTKTIYVHPGRRMLRQIEQFVPSEDVTKGTPPSAQGSDALWKLVEDAPSVETLLAVSGQRPVTEVVRSLVLHKIVEPLLDIRRRSGERAFRTSDGYMEYMLEMPQAPFTVYKSGIVVADYLTAELQKTLWEYIFTERIMNALFGAEPGGAPIILCPRRFDQPPGLSLADFEPVRGCRTWIAEMACGSWQPRHPIDLPTCGFRHFLTFLRVAGI